MFWLLNLFSLRREPLNNLLNVGALKGGNGQDHPGGFHDVVELKFVNEFGFSDVWVEIDLVGTDQHGGGSNTSIVQQLVKFLLGHSKLLRGGRINNVKDDVTALGISRPFASVLFLTTNVPTFHIDLSLFEDFHVESDRWNGFDGLAVSQDGKKSGLSAVI